MGSKLFFVCSLACSLTGNSMAYGQQTTSASHDDCRVYDQAGESNQHVATVGTGKCIEDIVLFANDDDKVPSDFGSRFKTTIDLLRDHRDYVVVVEAHTSLVAPKAYNQRLSERRANSVRKALIKEGIKPEQISFIAYGKTRPLYPIEQSGKEQQADRRATMTIELPIDRQMSLLLRP